MGRFSNLKTPFISVDVPTSGLVPTITRVTPVRGNLLSTSTMVPLTSLGEVLTKSQCGEHGNHKCC